MNGIDVLVVGAGPAGLAAAIRLKQRLNDEKREASVVVIDKAAAPGRHNLSGAVIEPACLDELYPGWREARPKSAEVFVPIEHDELYYLTPKGARRVPPAAMPKAMRDAGNVSISASKLVELLAEYATSLGVEVYHGFSVGSLIVENGVVKGVRLADVGLAHDGSRKSNFREGEEIRAHVTIIGDGSRGVISTQLGEAFATAPHQTHQELEHAKAALEDLRASQGIETAERHREIGTEPQVYSIGIKAIVRLPDDNKFGTNRSVRTLGFPLGNDVFGGGFLYNVGAKTVAVGLMMGLDWKYGNLNPRHEFELLRAHPFIADLLAGGTTLATGAKTLPEGGYHALNRLSVPGALVVGDGAGFVHMEKMKGVQYAIQSGMCAGETAAWALQAPEAAAHRLSSYKERLAARGILAEFHRARNYRQAFRWGTMVGAPLSQVATHLPVRLHHREDHLGTKAGTHRPHPKTRVPHRELAANGQALPAEMDAATFVSLAGSIHREDEPSHVHLLDPARCAACGSDFGHACTAFCPGQVYRWDGDQLILSPSNCLHCMTCTVKCPYENIQWTPPEGGEGPRYTQM